MKNNYKTPEHEFPISRMELPELTIESLFNCDFLLFLDDPLTRAERDVAFSFVFGLTYSEIANQRQVSRETIKKQVSTILSKSGKLRRMDLLRFVIEQNLTLLGNRPTVPDSALTGRRNEINTPAQKIDQSIGSIFR